MGYQTFINFCSQLPFKGHGYLKIKEESLCFSRKKTAGGLSFALDQLAKGTWNHLEQAALYEGLSILQEHLQNKTTNNQFIQRIKGIRKTLISSPTPLSEEQAFLQLMKGNLNASLSQRVKKAATKHELSAIRWISQKMWNGDAGVYQARMVGIYQGDHVLVEGDELYEHLSMCKCKRRISSHYTGILQRLTPLILQKWLASAEWHPQHEVYGPHLKELLFSKIIKGDKTYSWFQLENCRDANFLSFRPIDSIRHRIFNYISYQFMYRIHQVSTFLAQRKRMIFRSTLRKISIYYERCNIGPYGHGNTHANPIIIAVGKT